MKIVIIGYGVLGKSINDVIKTKYETVVIESTQLSDIEHHHDADGVIICDFDDIHVTVEKIPIFLPILIKCNILPAAIDNLHREFLEHSIVISPDFSKTTSSSSEFLNLKYMILGGEDPDCFWQDLFHQLLPQCKLFLSCSDKEAAFIKFALDGFLILKNAYFNEIYDICYNNGLDFSIVRQLIGHDARIGTDQTMVVLPNGQRGFDDSTLDINKFITWAEESGSNFDLLKTAIEYNNQLRKNY